MIEQAADVKQETFAISTAFVLGEHDGSHLDDLTGNPHPLSALKISMGTASLRGDGLQLAAASAITTKQQEWVRDQATGLLSSDDTPEVHAAAVTLSQLPREITNNVDVSLLAAHPHFGVRQAATILCMRQPERHRDTAMRLAADRDFRVRRTLAQAAARIPSERSQTVTEILGHSPKIPGTVSARHPPASAGSPSTHDRLGPHCSDNAPHRLSFRAR